MLKDNLRTLTELTPCFDGRFVCLTLSCAVHKLKDNLRIFTELAGPVFPPRNLRSSYLVQVWGRLGGWGCCLGWLALGSAAWDGLFGFDNRQLACALPLAAVQEILDKIQENNRN